MNLCIVNEDHPQCNVPRKTIKACPGRGWALSWALSSPLALSHLESGHAVPFSPQDFCSPCEFVYCCHNTQIPLAGICINTWPVLPHRGDFETALSLLICSEWWWELVASVGSCMPCSGSSLSLGAISFLGLVFSSNWLFIIHFIFKIFSSNG